MSLRDDDTLKNVIIETKSILRGHTQNTGTLTLTANVATTTRVDSNCHANSVVLLSPTTANAAGALATLYVSSVLAGSFVLTHANNAQVDRTFKYTLNGR